MSEVDRSKPDEAFFRPNPDTEQRLKTAAPSLDHAIDPLIQ